MMKQKTHRTCMEEAGSFKQEGLRKSKSDVPGVGRNPSSLGNSVRQQTICFSNYSGKRGEKDAVLDIGHIWETSLHFAPPLD